MAFAEALRSLNELKSQGLVEDYAVAGALASIFWTEPVATYDLDVLVFLPGAEGSLISLEPLYRWASSRRYALDKEHIIVEGVPTQLIPSPGKLADEAIETAATLDYEGVPVRVVIPEYLIALCLQPEARTDKRRARAAMLLQRPGLNRSRLDDILQRHGLSV